MKAGESQKCRWLMFLNTQSLGPVVNAVDACKVSEQCLRLEQLHNKLHYCCCLFEPLYSIPSVSPFKVWWSRERGSTAGGYHPWRAEQGQELWKRNLFLWWPRAGPSVEGLWVNHSGWRAGMAKCWLVQTGEQCGQRGSLEWVLGNRLYTGSDRRLSAQVRLPVIVRLNYLGSYEVPLQSNPLERIRTTPPPIHSSSCPWVSD